MNNIQSLFAIVIPIALGAAVSPVLLTGAILLLSGKDRPKLKTAIFALGSMAVIVIIGLVGVFVFHMTLAPADAKHSPASKIIDLIIGLLLITLGVKKIIRPSEKKSSSLSKFQSGKLSSSLYAGIILMAVNFSTLVLYIGAIKQIGEAKIDSYSKIGILFLVDIIIMIPVFVPLLLYILVPKLAEPLLDRVNNFLTKHGNIIIAILLFVFGAYLILKSRIL